MKLTLFVSLLIVLLLAVGTFAMTDSAEVAADVFGGTADDSSDLGSITAEISADDLLTSEKKIDEVIKRENPRELPRARVIITEGHGWAVVSNGKAAFVNFKAVTKQAENADGDQVLTLSQGKINVGKIKFDMKATQDTETIKSYSLVSGDGSVTGTLVLNRQSNSVYNDGNFAVWNGDLTVSALGESFEADVTLALENHKVGNQKIEEYKQRVKSSYTGWLSFAELQFKFHSTSNAKPDRLEFRVYGQNNVEGKMVLERERTSEGEYNYVGALKVEESGDRDDRIEAKLRANLVSDGNKLSGKILVRLDDSSSAGEGTYEGEITIYEETTYSSVPAQAVPAEPRFEIDSDDSSSGESSSDDSSQDNSGSNSGSKKGFWKKFFGIFGGSDST